MTSIVEFLAMSDSRLEDAIAYAKIIAHIGMPDGDRNIFI